MSVAGNNQSPVAPGRNPMRRTFASFRNYNYRLFWSGQLISQIGTWMQRIGQAWLVLEISHSPTALGTVTALQFLPILLLSLFAGVIVDRLPKYRIMLLTQSLLSLQSVIMAVLTISGQIQLWEIYVLALVLGLITAYDNPNRQSFLMELVGRENLVNAVGLNSATFNAARLVGPAIGGLIIAAWGVGFCFGVDAISYLGVLIGLLLMHTDQLHPLLTAAAPQRMVSQFTEGIRFVFRTPEAVVIVIVLGLIGCFGYNFTVIMPLLAENAYHIGAGGFGLLMSAVGLGSLVAAITIATVGHPSQRNLLVSAAAFSLLLLLTALAPWVALVVVILVLAGYASQFFSAMANTLLQFLAPDYLRGRVMSVYMLLFAGTTPIGALVSGYLANALGVRAALGIEATICLAASAAGAIYWKLRVPRALTGLPTPSNAVTAGGN